MMEGIFICAAPHCLRSFIKKPDFEAHVHDLHATLLQPDADKEEDGNNESEVQSTKQQQSSASESTLRGPLRSQQQQQPSLHRSSSLSKPQPGFGQAQSYPAAENDNSRPPGFETASPRPGVRFPDYGPPMNMMQPPPPSNMPMNQNPFGFPSYPATSDGSSQQYYNNSGAPFEMTKPEGGSSGGSEQGIRYPNQNFQGSYPPPPPPPQSSWNPGMAPSQQVNKGQGFGRET